MTTQVRGPFVFAPSSNSFFLLRVQCAVGYSGTQILPEGASASLRVFNAAPANCGMLGTLERSGILSTAQRRGFPGKRIALTEFSDKVFAAGTIIRA